MSRFADKLKNALHVIPPTMGFFRSAAPAGKPRMLVVSQLTPENVEAAPDMMKGTDAVLLTCTKVLSARVLKMLVKAAGDIPLGIWFTKTRIKAMEGVDFGVYTVEDTLSGGYDGNDKILVVPLDLSDSFARTLNDLPVESVMVNIGAVGTLTWMDLMRLYRLGDCVTKPLLAQVVLTISESEISMLWDAGVDALVVSVSGENQADFEKLRTTMGSLKLTPKRKWIKTRAIVPVIKHDESGSGSDDDDDNGDDE